MNRYITLLIVVLSFFCGSALTTFRPRSAEAAFAEPSKSLLICGISDHPCVTYTVSYHEPSSDYGDQSGEGVTDYEKKTISIASSNDRFENVRALEHEVCHAVLHEHGVSNREVLDVHSWIYLSEGPFAMVLHDNPTFVRYLMTGYRSPGP
jgi:hypothetical protein